MAALLALVRVRWPSREQAIRRVEAVSGVKHRPASSYEDTLTLGAGDARTEALWRVHRQRLAALLQKLRVGHPSPRADRYDPFALRALLLLGVFVLLVVVGDSASDRLRSAFRFGALAKGAEARIDAWVTPPAYTGKPPIMLADGGFSGLRAAGEAGRTHGDPRPQHAGRARIGRGAGRAQRSKSPGSDGDGRSASRRRRRPRPPTWPSSSSRCASRAPSSVYGGGTQLAELAVRQVTPDNPPKISLTKEPERTPRGALKLFFKVEDDYGVVSAETPHPPRSRPRRTRPRPPGPAPAPRRAPGRPTSARRRWRCGCRAPTPSRPRARASTRSATIPGPA